MKIFENYLNEETSKQIEVPGWKKSTKAKLIKELTDKKSLYISTWGPSDKDGEYILNAMKEEFTDSKLKKVFSILSSTNKWRTVSGASQTKLIFRPEGRVDFNQVGDKWFYEKKLFDGTVFLFYTRTYNKQWDDWSHLFIFYYVPDNVNGEYIEEEQKMFSINEDWSSDITKVFGKQFLTYTRSSQFLNDNDIDIAKSDYEIIDAPYSLKKFKKYPFVIVKTEDSLPIIFEIRTNGDWFIHKSNGKNTSVDFDEVVAAVGIKKVVRNTELKQKRKDDYEDTRAAKEKDPINANRVKRIMRSFKK